MARIAIEGDKVVVRLSWPEKFADLSIRDLAMPLSAVQQVDVVDDPHTHFLPAEIDFGFAGNTAPARKAMTLKSRAKCHSGGRAFVAVYLDRPAIVVRLATNETGYRIVVVSSKNATDTATEIANAAGL